MPIGVVLDTQKKYELKTLEGAFVVVRRMNYGESLKRQSMATKLSFDGGQTGKDFKGALDIQQELITMWDFANLVVEHNITDVDDRLLNFKNKSDVQKLDGAIGQEIGEYIDEYNQFENLSEIKNS